MGREFELKYKADEAVLSQIREKFGKFSAIAMETAYYDTPAGALEQRKWMLRLRKENGVSVCTLKTPLPDGSRGEWECDADSVESGVAGLCRLNAPEELAGLARNGLVQTCAARFTRLASTLVLEHCTVELALDAGCFIGSGKELPFSELEVELKAGSEEAAAAFAQGLAAEFGLVPETKSKVQRALKLVHPRG